MKRILLLILFSFILGQSPSDMTYKTERKILNNVYDDNTDALKQINVDADGNLISSNYPLAVDGDAIYEKDVWLEQSTSASFTGGDVTDLFNDLHSVITNITTDNPKTIFVHFNRTVVSNAIGLGAYAGSFSNVKIEIVTSGEVSTTVIDESASDTEYTSRTFQLPVTAGFNALRFTFATTDTITLSNIVILKSMGVVARLQAKKPDNTITDINATAGGNLKISMEELESGISSNSNSQLNVTPFGSSGTEYKQDAITGAFTTVDYAHHEIHSGSHYYIEGIATMALGDSIMIKLVTPNTTKWAHFLWEITSSDVLTTILYEDVSGGMAGGSGITPLNNNRNSVNTSGLTITQGVTIATDLGTTISQCKWGTKQAGGGQSREDEIILKQDATYLRLFVSGANGNLVCFKAIWYEHTSL